MRDKKIVFLILHYMVENETINCVNSIVNNIDTNNYEIVIVDNYSPNKTGNLLKQLYKTNEKIHVLQTKENLGFTGGNNFGFLYAKKNLNADYICMMNNDTYIIQNDFFDIINKEFKKSSFAVLGPEIHLLNGGIEKIQKKIISLKKLRLNTLKLKIKLICNYLNIEIIEEFLEEKLKKILKFKNNSIINEKSLRLENVVLHGCCLVFSPIYIEQFDGLDQKTFLYREEEFLYIKLLLNKMKSVYNPKLKIFHNEKQSTITTNKKLKRKSVRFRYKNLIMANKILFRYMKKERIGE